MATIDKPVAPVRVSQNARAEGKIIIRLDVMLAFRKMELKELANHIGVQPNNLSILKLGKGKSIKLKTLMRICTVLDCKPNDIIEINRDKE